MEFDDGSRQELKADIVIEVVDAVDVVDEEQGFYDLPNGSAALLAVGDASVGLPLVVHLQKMASWVTTTRPAAYARKQFGVGNATQTGFMGR